MEFLFHPDNVDLTAQELYNGASHAFRAYLHKAASEYCRLTERTVLDADDQVELSEQLVLGSGMLKQVLYQFDRKKYKPVLVETEALVQLVHPITKQPLYCHCYKCRTRYLSAYPTHEDWVGWRGLPVVFGLRVDAVVVDDEGLYWVIDFKTAAQLFQDQTFLDLDLQGASYVWALRQGLGLNIAGFLYFQIRKTAPHPPKELKQLNGGRRFSTAKNQLTTTRLMLSTIKQHDRGAWNAGFYDDYLEYLRDHEPEFVKLFKVLKTPEQLTSTGTTLGKMALVLLEPDPIIFHNPSRMTCERCSFIEPCLSMNAGHDFQDQLDSDYSIQPAYYERQRDEHAASLD